MSSRRSLRGFRISTRTGRSSGRSSGAGAIVLGQLVLGGATIVMLVTSCDLHLNVSPILVPVMGFAMVALIVCAALSIRPLHPTSKGAEAREFLERMRALEVRVQSLPEQPDWFVGSDGFNAVMFASTVRSFSTAMTTPLNTSSWTGTGGVRSRAARSAADSPVGGGGR